MIPEEDQTNEYQKICDEMDITPRFTTNQRKMREQTEAVKRMARRTPGSKYYMMEVQ